MNIAFNIDVECLILCHVYLQEPEGCDRLCDLELLPYLSEADLCSYVEKNKDVRSQHDCGPPNSISMSTFRDPKDATACVW